MHFDFLDGIYVKFVFFLLLFISFPLQASYIELINGDRLMGSLVRVEGDYVIWKTENFGEQSIPKLKVKNLFSSTPWKINGNSTPCIVEGVEDENLVYYCGLRANMSRVPLLSIEVMTPYEDFIKNDFIHTGRLALRGAYVRGNEVRDEWTIQGEASMRRGEWRHNFRGEFAEASWWYSRPTLKWNIRYTLDWFFKERWFWYNDVTIGAEEQRGLDQYTSLGSGTGYQFWESSATALAVKGGVAYFDEQYSTPVINASEFDPNDTFTAGYLATDFRYRLPWGVGFFHNNEFIQSLDASNNWHLKSATGLSAMLISRIYSEIKLDYNIDNDPQPGRETYDKRMTVGVSYKW